MLSIQQKSQELLEFPQVKSIIAGLTEFSRSHELVLELSPSSDYEIVITRLQRSAEARNLLQIEPSFSVGPIRDVSAYTAMASRGKMLEPSSLLEIQSALAVCNRVHAFLAKRRVDFPLLSEMAVRITPLPEILNEIYRTISPGGEVLSSASDKLAQIRRQLKSVREQLLKELGDIVKSEEAQKALQESIITQREGRYVVPVRVEHKRDLKGIIHDVSNTGATVFIEPWSTVETGNELKQLEIEEVHEIERILTVLSGKIGSYNEEITLNIDTLARIDLELAKARYAEAARAVEPTVTRFADSRVVRLVTARHPLLKGKVIPLDIEIGNGFNTLVITGPNTGGKTVALKTIGLLCIMAQSGFPVPADAATTLPVFDSVFADIGDEQSILQTLSSFSAHVTNIRSILEGATQNSLILLDELGTSTDPVEGSALAAAIIEYFISIQATTIATSHFNELKALAHAAPGAQNAAFEFDPVTLMPTFKLMTGIPGGSNALITAARLGIPAHIIENAKTRLSTGGRELDRLLTEMASERTRANNLAAEAEKQKQEAEKLKGELEKRIQEINRAEERIISQARDAVVKDISALHNTIKETQAELRKNRSKIQLQQAKEVLSETRNRLEEISSASTETLPSGKITPGDTVWLKELGMEAVVASVNETTNQLTAEAGAMRFTLSACSATRITPSLKQRRILQPKPTSFTSRQPVSLELDLRGKRISEVEMLLDDYMSNAALNNIDFARIIHGYGTGALRTLVREYMAGHRLVKSIRPGERDEGGDGVTVVAFK